MQGHEEEAPMGRRTVRDRVRYFEGELQADHGRPATAPDLHEEPNTGAVEERTEVDVANTHEKDDPDPFDARQDNVSASERETADPQGTDDTKTKPRDTKDIVLEPPSPQAEGTSSSAFLQSAAERRRRELRAEVSRVDAKDSVSRNTASSLLDKVFKLRDRLEDERVSNRGLLEKLREARARSDQLTAELKRERVKSCHLENKALAQERQAQNLRSRIQDVKEAYDEKERKATAIPRERLSLAEERLEIAEKEKEELLQTKRNTERRLKETMAQLEVAKVHRETLHEDKNKADSQLRGLRGQLNEAQEELSREKDQTRNVKRELEAALEVRTRLRGELRSLHDDSRRAGSAASSSSASVSSLDRGKRDPGHRDPASLHV